MDVTPDERVSYLIGEIQRADVRVEDLLRGVWLELAQELSIAGEPPRDFRGIHPDVKRMMSEVEIPKEFKSAALDLLRTDVWDLHNERNRIVHDRWVQDGLRGQIWLGGRLTREPEPRVRERELESFVQCRTDLLRMWWRVDAMNLSLHHYLRPGSGTYNFVADLNIMAGGFTMTDTGLTIAVDAR